jgi:hypothetical protein
MPCPSRPLPSNVMPGFELAPWQLGTLHPVTGDLDSLLICRWHPPTVAAGRSTTITATDPAVRPLLAALGLAPHPTRYYCRAHRYVPQVIVLRTTTGNWAARIPSDGCGQPRPPVQRAIEHALQ